MDSISARKLRSAGAGTGSRMTDKTVAILLILPALAIFLTVILYPFLNSVLMSFTNRSLLTPEWRYVGLSNYARVLADPGFRQTVANTVIFVFFSTLIPFSLGLIWAIILNTKFRGAGFLRGVTLVDWIIPGASISFLWSFAFDANHGVFNAILHDLGLISTNINWLGQGGTAMMAVIIARSWQMLPWYMAFLTGGLQGVAKEQIEAARMDGAGNIRVFTKVIWPSMKAIVGIVVVLGTIGNLQHFDIPQVMTGGGPAGATTMFSTAVYRQAFSSYKTGTAATYGTIWAILLAGFSAFYLKRTAED